MATGATAYLQHPLGVCRCAEGPLRSWTTRRLARRRSPCSCSSSSSSSSSAAFLFQPALHPHTHNAYTTASSSSCPNSNFLKGVKWSPDGACCLTASDDKWCDFLGGRRGHGRGLPGLDLSHNQPCFLLCISSSVLTRGILLMSAIRGIGHR